MTGRFAVKLIACVLLTTIVAHAADRPPVSYRLFSDAWSGAFKVGTPRHDPANYTLSVVLEARQKTRLAKYEALVSDPDNTPAGTVEVKFSPLRAEYKAGARITATISLREIDPDNVSRILIRAKK